MERNKAEENHQNRDRKTPKLAPVRVIPYDRSSGRERKKATCTTVTASSSVNW